MSAIINEQILLLGLPGSGRTRFKQQFDNFVSDHAEKPDLVLSKTGLSEAKIRIWCLIDIRSPVNSSLLLSYLESAVRQASAVIFNFVESSDLTSQMHWQNWLKEVNAELPIFRFFHQTFSEDWHWQSLGKSVSQDRIDWPPPFFTLETLTYEVKTLHLQHFLMGLDAARNNLQMDIYRVKAQVMTTEYINPVAIEITPFRVDTYAAEQSTGLIEVQGLNLDKDWFNQLIEACEAPFIQD